MSRSAAGTRIPPGVFPEGDSKLPTTPVRESLEPPDPFDDAEALVELEHRIGTLAAHVHAASHRLLVLLAEFDRRMGWKLGGHRSCSEWLHFRTGFDRGTSREKVRTARALERLPVVSASMALGELSFSKVRALTRLSDVLDPEAEVELVDFARSATTADLEKVVRGWKTYTRRDEAELERRRHQARSLSIFPDEEGGYVIRGRLDPEVGAMLMRSLEAAVDALHRPGATWSPGGGLRGPGIQESTPGQRRADALGLLAERALAAGFGEAWEAEGNASDDPALSPDVSAETSASCPSVRGSGAVGSGTEDSGPVDPGAAKPFPLDPSAPTPDIPRSGTRAERFLVFLHVDHRTRRSGQDPQDRQEATSSHLEDGTRIPHETSRRLCCDASIVRVARGEKGEVLDVGRRSRTIPPALRRALEVRDAGCRFPGCGLRFTEGHHIRHWADGGMTRLDNLVLLCRAHHRALHEEGFRIRAHPGGGFRFINPLGWPLPDCPPPPRVPDRPVETLIQRNVARGTDPDGWSCASRYEQAAHIPWGVEARLREALDR